MNASFWYINMSEDMGAPKEEINKGLCSTCYGPRNLKLICLQTFSSLLPPLSSFLLLIRLGSKFSPGLSFLHPDRTAMKFRR